MDTIIKQFGKVSQNRPEEFVQFYFENIVQIAKWIESLEGLKTSYRLFNLSRQSEWIRFSLIFSDTLILYPQGGVTKKIVIPKDRGFSKSIETITMPQALYNDVVKSGMLDKLVLGYISCDPSKLKDYHLKLKPFIKSRRIILCPDRIAFKIENDPKRPGHKIYNGIPVSSDTPYNKWVITPHEERINTIPLIENISDPTLKKELFTLSIPYLKNISFSELSKVLDDNKECLSILRSHLKSIVIENRGIMEIQQIQEDLIRPEIDKLNARFKKVQNIHKLRTSGVVIGSALISLASIDKLGASAAILSLLGSAGLGLFKSEEKYQKEFFELTENPLYLLWQLKGLQ